MVQIPGPLCLNCGEEAPVADKENCEVCEALLDIDRLAEEAAEMEKDDLLTEEDDLHGSITGC